MATKGKSRKSRKSPQVVLGKPAGIIQPRVQEVGPEHFGIVAVDCAKARSRWMFCDFYGKILIPPSTVEHTKPGLETMLLLLDEASRQQDIRDRIAAIEMTGTYHAPVKRAFKKAGWDTRLVHPFASRHYRLPAHPDEKTDDHDLEAIFRAAVNGFGLLEPSWDASYLAIQLLSRQRRDLVEKRAKLHCQIRELIHRCLPGYTALFPDQAIWTSDVALCVARRAGNAETIRQAGIPGVTRWLREENRRFQSRTVGKIIAWSANAAPADPMAPLITQLWQTLDDDRQAKTQQISQLERKIAAELVNTPYILLLSHPGINIVGAGELTGETGPIEHYANSKAITGRAGLFPSRYQSDEVDHADGSLARFRNHRMRIAWLRVADNLIKCNAHYRGQAELWKSKRVDSRDIRVRVANRVSRPIFQMILGRKVYDHPSRLDRGYILDKLLVFYQEHQAPPHEILRDLSAAMKQIPVQHHAEEAAPIREKCQRHGRSHRAGPQAIGTILVEVLAKLGVGVLQSNVTEAQDPESPCRTLEPDNAVAPKG
jgi:transposase